MMCTVLNETIIFDHGYWTKEVGEKAKTNRHRTQEKKSGISFYLKKSR